MILDRFPGVALPVRAVICDIYGTLLLVKAPPPDSPARWLEQLGSLTDTMVSLAEFDDRCGEAIAVSHTARRVAGEGFPEVDWYAVIRAALPGVSLTNDQVVKISRLHAACSRQCLPAPDAAAVLPSLQRFGLLIGLASNAQPYTVEELTSAGFPPGLFDSSIRFLSGESGFAKPSPRVFSLLTARLAARGIGPGETLMVGDSLENDIRPAAAAGWQTWHMDHDHRSSWQELGERLTGLAK